jgi:hypothetical protein
MKIGDQHLVNLIFENSSVCFQISVSNYQVLAYLMDENRIPFLTIFLPSHHSSDFIHQ